MKKMRTAVLGGLLSGVLLLGAAAASTAQVTADLRNDITVKVDGQTQALRDGQGKVITPIAVDGSVYLPVRAIGQALGRDVSWDGRTNTVNIDAKPGTTTPAPSPAPTGTYGDYVAKLDDLDGRVATQAKAVYAYTAPVSRQIGRDLDTKLEALDSELDQLDDAMERDYRAGRLTAADYRVLDAREDEIDRTLDSAMDYLEDVLGYDD